MDLPFHDHGEFKRTPPKTYGGCLHYRALEGDPPFDVEHFQFHVAGKVFNMRIMLPCSAAGFANQLFSMADQVRLLDAVEPMPDEDG